MPKFQVSITRQTAKPEIVEVTADSPEEACWLALSSTDGWKDVEARAVSLDSVSAAPSRALQSAA
jgi:hypothetical protein